MKNLTEKRKKEKYSYLIAFNLKCVDQTMGSNEDQMLHSPPSSDALQSARLVRLFGRISKQTASSTTAVHLGLIGRARGDLTAVGEGGAGGPGAHLRQALVCLVDLNT